MNCLIFLLVLISFLSNGQCESGFRAAIILGHSDLQVSKNAFAQTFVNSTIDFNNQESASFIIVHSDESRFLDKQFDRALVQSNFLISESNRLLVVSTKGTDEMSLEELGILKEIIYYVNGGLIVVEIGKKAVQTSVILEHSTFCWGLTSFDLNVPNTVFLCNDVHPSSVPILRNLKISSIFEKNRDPVISSTTWFTFLPSAMAADSNVDKKHNSHKTIQPNQRHMYYKQNSNKKSTNTEEEDEITISEGGKKKMKDKLRLSCKYRKSCYETGQLPEVNNGLNIDWYSWLTAKEEQEREVAHNSNSRKNNPHNNNNNNNNNNHEDNDNDDDDNDELKKKNKCKYRLSCYQETGIEMSEANKKKARGVFATKTATLVKPSDEVKIKKKSAKELAQMVVKEVEEKDKKIAANPTAKLSPIDIKLGEMEQKLLMKNRCKYRKSCYETGKVPEIETMKVPEWLSSGRISEALNNYVPKKKVDDTPFEEKSEDEKKLFCKYRKSCYGSGTPPEIKTEEIFKIKDAVEQAKSVVKVKKELACKYRKSCYETGILPDIKKVEAQKLQTEKVKPVPLTLDGLKLNCKYRKSCYKEKLEELEQKESEKLSDSPKPKVKESKKEEKVKVEVPVPDKKPKKIPKSKETLEEPVVEKVDVSAKSKKQKKRQSAEIVEEVVEKVEEEVEEKVAEETVTIQEESPRLQKKSKKYKSAEVVEEVVEKVEEEVEEKVVEETATIQEEPPRPQKRSKKYKSAEVVESTETKSEPPVKEEVETVVEPEIKEPKLKKSKKPKSSEKQEEKSEKLTPVFNIDPNNITKADKHSCKYRKSCYQTGIPAVLNNEVKYKDVFSHPVKKEMKEYTPEEWEKLPEKIKQAQCKYRKSCYESGKIPDVSSESVRYFSTYSSSSQDGSREHRSVDIADPSKDNLQLRCKYRKSCYETGKLPDFGPASINNVIEKIKEDPRITVQQKCKYRKSCYAAMEAGEPSKHAEAKAKVIDEEMLVVKTPKPEVTQKPKKQEPKSEEKTDKSEKADKSSEKPSKKQGKKPSSAEKKKKSKEEIDEEEYKEIPLQSAPTTSISKEEADELAKNLTTKMKSACKYRHSCYGSIASGTPPEKVALLQPIKCSKYRLSCREQMGLPPIEKAPIGPNGRKLCRKKNATRTR